MKTALLFFVMPFLFISSELLPMHRIKAPYTLALRYLATALDNKVSFPIFTKTVSYLEEKEGKPALIYTTGTLQLVNPPGVYVREVEQQHTITIPELTHNFDALCACIRELLARQAQGDAAHFSGRNPGRNNIAQLLTLLPIPLQQHYKNMIVDLTKNQPCDTDSHGTSSEMQFKRGTNNQMITEYTTKLFLTKPEQWMKQIIKEQKKQIAQSKELLRLTSGKKPHEILGVPENAKPEEIQSAYYKKRLANEKNQELVDSLRKAYLDITKKHQ